MGMLSPHQIQETQMNSSQTHLIIDMETLGTKPNSVVLSMACVPFNFNSNVDFESLVKSSFYVKFDTIEQIQHHKRKVDENTVNWWKKQQSEEAKSVIRPSKNDVSLETGLRAFSKFVGSTGYDFKNSFVWSRGIAFDGPLLESIYDNVDTINIPVNTWLYRDIRTYVDTLEGSIDGYGRFQDLGLTGVVKHNALHDVCCDVIRMKKIYDELMS